MFCCFVGVFGGSGLFICLLFVVVVCLFVFPELLTQRDDVKTKSEMKPRGRASAHRAMGRRIDHSWWNH